MTMLPSERLGQLRIYAVPLCVALGVLVSLAIFLHPTEILLSAGLTVVLWVLLARIVRLRWRATPSVALWPALLAAITLMLLASHDRRLYCRHLLQVLLVSGPILLGFYRAQVARRWREVLVLLVTSAFMVGLVWLAGPLLLGRILPGHNLDIDHRNKPFDKALKTNEDGVVSPFAPSDFRAEDYNIIFLGDSFTHGKLAPKPFPLRVEEMLSERFPGRRFRSANFGWTSSSPVLQARQLLDIGAKYKPKLVVQCFDMTDFHDDLKYTHWFRERGIEPVQITIFQAGWTVFSKALGVEDYREWLEAELRGASRRGREGLDRPRPRYFALEQPLEATEPFLQTSWDAILDTRAVAQKLGAEYVLFILPRYQQFNRRESPSDWERDEWPAADDHILEPFKYFARQAATAPFPIHSLLEPFRDSGIFPVCFKHDPHWNQAGHEIAARAITDHLVRDGVVK